MATLPSLASVDDLSSRIEGGIAVADEDRAQALLDDVSALIRAEAETDWVDDSNALDSVPDVVVTICLSAARRAWQNPGGYVSETIGGYSYRVADGGTSGLYLTEEEKRLIRRASQLVDSGVASVELNPERIIDDTIYIAVEGDYDQSLPVYSRFEGEL